VRSVSRRLPGCLPELRSVEPPAAGCLAGRLLADQAVKRADWWA